MLDRSMLLLFLPLLPLIGSVLAVLCGSVRELKARSYLPVVVTALLATVCSFLLLQQVLTGNEAAQYPAPGDPSGPFLWFGVDDRQSQFRVDFTLYADHMAALMLVAVNFIAFWIFVFSIGYMHGSPGVSRYFAVVSLFLASMNLLVTADNMILMLAGWEGVGLCSYLLIGYWHARPAAAAAARKALLVTRLGDVALILGLFMLWSMSGQRFSSLQWMFSHASAMHEDAPGVFTAACFLITLGAIGKSAQFPLYVWLPDAMEGPTPVSALIHAATMVTAGVYLLARCVPLLLLEPIVLMVIAGLGGFTALLAAAIAVTQHDLKRVLAYSTVSQIGFMFLALGGAAGASPVLAVAAAMFHLFTHAFFKALLFLASGSVMHAMNDVIDMRQFSGLRRVLPITHAAFLIGAMALAGVPVLSGFVSKDLIFEVLLEACQSAAGPGFYAILLVAAGVTAILTAFYSFRAYFRTFWGLPRIPDGSDPHEPTVMAIPMMVLAIGAVGVGVTLQFVNGWFSEKVALSPFLADRDPPVHHWNWVLAATGTAAAAVGIGGAYLLYAARPSLRDRVRQTLGWLYHASEARFFIDEIYLRLFVRPLELVSGLVGLVEALVADAVRMVASIPRGLGMVLRPLQNGLVQFYAVSMVLAAAALLAAYAMIWRS